MERNMQWDLSNLRADRLEAFLDHFDTKVSPVTVSLQRVPGCGSPVMDLGGHLNAFARRQMDREQELSLSNSIADFYGMSAEAFYNLHMAQAFSYRVNKSAFDSLHPVIRKSICDMVVRKLMQHGSTDWYGPIRSVVPLPLLARFIEWGAQGRRG
jgi:hypothetical protein